MSFDTVFNSVVSPWCHVTLPTLAFAETPPPPSVAPRIIRDLVKVGPVIHL